MKVILHGSACGQRPGKSAVATRSEGRESIFTLSKGWGLAIPELPDPLTLPKTVEAKRL